MECQNSIVCQRREEELIKEQKLILAINSGSSSIKFGIFKNDGGDEAAVCTASVEGIGRANGSFDIRSADGKSLTHREGAVDSQSHALALLVKAMSGHGIGAPDAVGHRVVHGGPKLRTHQIITPQVLTDLKAATHFAPLHIPQSLALIAAAQKTFPSAAHYMCLDNAFHNTIPEVASRFPLPQRYFDAGVHRYGFHGLSYESLVHHFGAHLPGRSIFAHLGNGASLCALRNGISIDTTMGLTPTGGILMGTRSGDLDPGVFLYLMRNENLNADALEELLNHESGLFALSAGESDVKALQERARNNDSRAILALEAFAISVRKMIGAYVAMLGGVDLLVFTGGIGEHSEYVRSRATSGLEAFGITADRVQVVRAEEEEEMARLCRALMTS